MPRVDRRPSAAGEGRQSSTSSRKAGGVHRGSESGAQNARSGSDEHKTQDREKPESAVKQRSDGMTQDRKNIQSQYHQYQTKQQLTTSAGSIPAHTSQSYPDVQSCAHPHQQRQFLSSSFSHLQMDIPSAPTIGSHPPHVPPTLSMLSVSRLVGLTSVEAVDERLVELRKEKDAMKQRLMSRIAL